MKTICLYMAVLMAILMAPQLAHSDAPLPEVHVLVSGTATLNFTMLSAAPAPVQSAPIAPIEPIAAPKEEIRMLFGGDVTLGGDYPVLAPDPFNDFKWPFMRLQPLFSAMDIIMVNCENPITTHEVAVPKQFNFKMDPRLVPIFKQNGIDLVTIANNHVFDYGRQGLVDTLKALDEAGVQHVGAGMNLAEARKPVWRDIKGRKVAFLGYGNYSEAGPNRPGVAYRYAAHIAEDIMAVKQGGAELVVVNFHWGEERATEPNARDRALAHLAVDSGADVVVGHHPHVLQPVEIYRGKVIAYSLGNFVFGGNSKRPRESALLKVTVAPDDSLACELVPIIIDPQETRYQPYIKGQKAVESQPQPEGATKGPVAAVEKKAANN